MYPRPHPCFPEVFILTKHGPWQSLLRSPLNLQPKGQCSPDRLIISIRSLLNTKEEEKEMNLSDLSLQHLVGRREKNILLAVTQCWVQILPLLSPASWLWATTSTVGFGDAKILVPLALGQTWAASLEASGKVMGCLVNIFPVYFDVEVPGEHCLGSQRMLP